MLAPLRIHCSDAAGGAAPPSDPTTVISPEIQNLMLQSRRMFLRAGTLAALSAGAVLSPLKSVFAQAGGGRSAQAAGQDAQGYFQVPQEAKSERGYYFTKSTFEPHLNTDFKSRLAVVTTTLRLIAIEDCPTPAATEGAGECFSLTFRADRELTDLTTLHVFEHAALGEFPMFVSKTVSKGDPRGHYYVAVVNHRIETGPRRELHNSPKRRPSKGGAAPAGN